MTLTRLNPFTRWFIIATSLIVAALLIYAGKALAEKPNRPLLGQSEVTAAKKPAPVTILPDRIILPPQVPQASVTLSAYNVETSVQDNVATTTITQTFKNASGNTLEACYLFPLPKDANFSSLTLTVNGKALEGKILEKAEAKSTYESIVRKLVDPALLEYIDDQTVQVSIAPFFAGESKQIRLSYTQLLKQDGGLYKYTYYLGSQKPGSVSRPGQPRPMMDKVGSDQDAVAADGFSLNLDLKTGQPLKTVYSPTHDPKVERSGNRQASVKLHLKPAEIAQEKNFVLYFSQDNNAIALNTLNYQKAGEEGYFLMTLRTPEASAKQTALPKDVVLVLDTSGSMSGEKIQQAKEAMKFIINRLRPEDRFGLMQFNTDVSMFQPEMLPASAEQKRKALAYVDTLNADGSTNIEAALKSGFSLLKGHDAKRPAYLIFLTDGEPTVGVTDTEGLVKVADQANTEQVRLFNFGVGYNLNAILLGKLADKNHGTTTFVEPNENLELALTGFYKKIESPVLTDADLRFDGISVSKQYPAEIGDLFAGSEVILLGRYAGNGKGTVKLSGKMGAEAKSFSFPIQWSPNTAHNQLPRLWAGRRIAYLLDAIRQNGENKELKDEIIALSKQYGIITPYTSYLSQEPEIVHGPMMNGGAMSPRPAAAPKRYQAMDASSGQRAVQLSKSLNAMKGQASAAALQAAQSVAAESGTMADPSLKTVGAKTFILSKEGVWIDTAYDKEGLDKAGKPITVTFGSQAYFDLLSQKPELLPYLSLGEQVLVVLIQPDGSRHIYQVQPAKADS